MCIYCTAHSQEVLGKSDKDSGSCQSYTKAAHQQSWSDLTLEAKKMISYTFHYYSFMIISGIGINSTTYNLICNLFSKILTLIDEKYLCKNPTPCYGDAIVVVVLAENCHSSEM